MLFKIIGISALAVAIVVAVIVFSSNNAVNNPSAPNVRFTEFGPDRLDIKIGESTKILFNVQNLEPRVINDSRVDIVIEPTSYMGFISIDNPSTYLSTLEGKDSRSGQKEVILTVIDTPAIEAIYKVKGVLFVEGNQTDVREFELKIRQE